MGVTKKQQVEKSLASDVSVNSDVTLEKISAKEEPDDYVCQTCGKHYKKRKGNFSPSKSPIYAGTDGYMNTCKNCVDELFIHYTNFSMVMKNVLLKEYASCLICTLMKVPLLHQEKSVRIVVVFLYTSARYRLNLILGKHIAIL